MAGAILRRSSSGRVALAAFRDVLPPDALPAAIRADVAATLADAYDQSATPLDFKQVERVLKSAWGQTPGKRLDDLEREPVAVTPAAQVHRAELDGTAVAIKIRRPGLASAVRNDLALLDALGPPLGAIFPAVDIGAMLREARESAQDELDLEHEGAQQRQVRRVLRDVEGLVVPAVHGDLTTEDVLVTDFLDGPTLRERDADDPALVARVLVQAHVVAWRDGGFALVDPRPGHVVLLDDGRVGLLGTGVARPASRDRAAATLDALAALRERDAARFRAAIAGDLALLPEAEAETAHDLAHELIGPLVSGAARLDGAALAAVSDRVLRRFGPLLRVAATGTPEPADMGPARSAGQLAGLLSRLGATEDWGRLATEATTRA